MTAHFEKSSMVVFIEKQIHVKHVSNREYNSVYYCHYYTRNVK